MKVQVIKESHLSQKLIKSICGYFLFLGVIALIICTILQYEDKRYRDELISIAEAINESRLIDTIDTGSNISGLYSDVNNGIVEIYYQYMMMSPIIQVAENLVGSEKLQKFNWPQLNEIDESIYKLCNRLENIQYEQGELVFTLSFLRNAVDNKDKLLLTNEEIELLSGAMNTDKSEQIKEVFSSKVEAITSEMGIIEPSFISVALLILTMTQDVLSFIMAASLIALPIIIIFIKLLELLWKQDVRYSNLRQNSMICVEK